MRHRFVSGYTDSSDSTLVKPSNWDDAHIYAYRSVSTSVTIAASDDVIYATGGAGGINLTMPSPVSNAGQPFIIFKVDSAAGAVTLLPNASETFNSLNNLGATSFILVSQGQCVEVISDGTNWWVKSAN